MVILNFSLTVGLADFRGIKKNLFIWSTFFWHDRPSCLPACTAKRDFWGHSTPHVLVASSI